MQHTPENLVKNANWWVSHCKIHNFDRRQLNVPEIISLLQELAELVSIMDAEIDRIRDLNPEEVKPKEVLDYELIIAEKNRLINELKEHNNNQAKIINKYESTYEKKYNHMNSFDFKGLKKYTYTDYALKA